MPSDIAAADPEHKTSHAVDRGTFATNLTALKRAQKPSRGTAAYSRLVNRPVGRLVAAAVHTYGLTPNQATASSAMLSSSAS